MNRRLILFALLGLTAPVVAQTSNATRLRGEAEAVRTRKRLTEAQQKLTNGKPEEVASDLQKILEESGDDLVLVKDHHFQPARRLVHQYLAALPADTLTTYRNRIEEPAQKLLDAGRKNRDPQPLRELLDRYFVSRPAESALLLLGELAFERGDFIEADQHWRKLLPDRAADELKYPAPKTPVAVVQAKLIMARLFAGDHQRASAELAQFRKDHPTATGLLAGVNGVYADTLARMLEAPPRVPTETTGWTTFAGHSSRDGKPDSPLPYRWGGRVTWKTPIPREGGMNKSLPLPPSITPSRSLVFHPVVLGDYAYLADAGRIFRFHLKTGDARQALHYEHLKIPPEFRSDRDATALSVPCTLPIEFTLTVGNGKLLARLGPVVLPDGSDQDVKIRTYLVAMEPKPHLNPPAGESTLIATWQVSPPVPKGIPAVWEGAPAYADGRLYASFVRWESSRIITAIACYSEPGGEKPLWVADVCDSDANRAGGAKHRDELLTVAGSNVIYTSHTGVTLAVNAATGKPAWAFRNPSPLRPPTSSPRALSPPLYSDGRVFLAPADGDTVFALDADSGRPLWSSAPELQMEHLLGVSRGHLIATMHSPSKGIRGFDVATGRSQEPNGWLVEGPGSFGRGIVDDHLILWPTQSGIGRSGNLQLLDPATGRQIGQLIPNVYGNLAYTNGVLLAATATELRGYVFDRIENQIRPAVAPASIFASNSPTPFQPGEVLSRPVTTFDPVVAPGLTAPAQVIRELPWPPGARPLAPIGPPNETLIAVCDGQTLYGIHTADGQTAWQARLNTPANLTYAAYATDGRVFAVGPRAVVCVGANGHKRWEFPVPDPQPSTEIALAGITGNRLVLRINDRTLLGLDASTGHVAWLRDTEGRLRFDPIGFDTQPRFGRHLAVCSGGIVVYRSDGTRHTLSLGDGTPREAERKSSLVEWVGPLAFLPQSDREVILPTGPTSVEAVDVNGNFLRWKFDAERLVSATGVPPQVRTLGDTCLMAVARNYGTDLHFLNAKNGKPKWREPAMISMGDPDLTAIDADRDILYVPTAERLFALRMDNGREYWSASLPALPHGTAWRVRIGRRAVIVHPTAAMPQEPLETVFERVAGRLIEAPTATSFPHAVVGLALAGTDWTFPMLLFDPESGRLLQRLDLPTSGPTVNVHLTADMALVASVGKGVWLGSK
jgi:outer membrane protein assembly factor BamB